MLNYRGKIKSKKRMKKVMLKFAGLKK